MSPSHPASHERTRTALSSLSTVGAALAGFGVGALFASPMAELAWPATMTGIVVHLFGMIGMMRLQSGEGYRPSLAEKTGYWLCWIVVATLLAYGAVEIAR